MEIGLANVITSRDANLAAGFMTFNRSELPWEMNYDEVNYVIEGDYVLTVDNQVFRARPGDVLYIPRGARVVFSAPGFAKVFYAAYPANWDELSSK
jgi:ethanolamine utilization protein EutQ